MSKPFTLQNQQLFLKNFMTTNPEWTSLLLYHSIGTGKTCSAIIMANEFIKMSPLNKVCIILPSRLRTNMIDELISPCGMNLYISESDYQMYINASTPLAKKNIIKAKFMKAIRANFNIISYDKFRMESISNGETLKSYLQAFTKNTMIIVDEVHNLVTTQYDNNGYENILKNGVLDPNKSYKGMNTILFKLMCVWAQPTCKMLFLSATPIFDNIAQLKELVLAMNPTVKIKANANISINRLVKFLKDKVSYFPGTNANEYPKVVYKIHDVKISSVQDKVIYMIQNTSGDETDENKDSFMVQQRQASLVCLPSNRGDLIGHLLLYAPKIKRVVEFLRHHRGKHIVYSSFVKNGVYIIRDVLEARGWKNIIDITNIKNGSHREATWKKFKNKVFAIWDGHTKDHTKEMIKLIANRVNNITGKYLKVIIGSPSIREGVSFKHIQHVHLLDPVWNISARTQIEGRAVRYCSHIDIDPLQKKYLKREVLVHFYKLIPRPTGRVKETSDQIIYDKIMKRKHRLVKQGENALKKIAIDMKL